MQRKLKPEAWIPTSAKRATEFLFVRAANLGLSLRCTKEEREEEREKHTPKTRERAHLAHHTKWRRMYSPSAFCKVFTWNEEITFSMGQKQRT